MSQYRVVVQDILGRFALRHRFQSILSFSKVKHFLQLQLTLRGFHKKWIQLFPKVLFCTLVVPEEYSLLFRLNRPEIFELEDLPDNGACRGCKSDFGVHQQLVGDGQGKTLFLMLPNCDAWRVARFELYPTPNAEVNAFIQRVKKNETRKQVVKDSQNCAMHDLMNWNFFSVDRRNKIHKFSCWREGMVHCKCCTSIYGILAREDDLAQLVMQHIWGHDPFTMNLRD